MLFRVLFASLSSVTTGSLRPRNDAARALNVPADETDGGITGVGRGASTGAEGKPDPPGDGRGASTGDRGDSGNTSRSTASRPARRLLSAASSKSSATPSIRFAAVSIWSRVTGFH